MSTVSDTGGGFIVGADPRTPPPTAADVAAQHPANTGPLVVVQGGQASAPQPTNGRFYSEEDVARMRAETDGRLQTMEQELQQLRTDREEREAAARTEQERLATEAQTAAEEAMDVRQLLEKRDQEFNNRLAEVEAQRQRDQAIFAREREWTALQDYKRNRIEQEQQFLMPQLRDLVTGNDVPEIDASIEEMKMRSAAIMSDMAQAVDAARPPMPLRAASPTGQPSMGGAFDMGQQAPEQVTLADINAMDNKTYGQYRDRLMAFATQSGKAPPV